MHVRPTQAVRRLNDTRGDPYGMASKAVSLISLICHAYLDQADRSRRNPKEGKRRVIKLHAARQARTNAIAHLYDRALRQDPDSSVCKKLWRRISKLGGLAAIAETSPSIDLILQIKENLLDVDYVVAIVDYLVRSKIDSDDKIPWTIEAAKGFVWKYFENYSISQIARLWEDYKLVAPYLFALRLEKSFRPENIEDADDVIDWVCAFVKNNRRISRLLGRAAFAMDVLSHCARDQRLLDVVGVLRIQPRLAPLSNEEKLIVANIDREHLEYGRSFRRFDRT